MQESDSKGTPGETKARFPLGCLGLQFLVVNTAP